MPFLRCCFWYRPPAVATISTGSCAVSLCQRHYNGRPRSEIAARQPPGHKTGQAAIPRQPRQTLPAGVIFSILAVLTPDIPTKLLAATGSHALAHTAARGRSISKFGDRVGGIRRVHHPGGKIPMMMRSSILLVAAMLAVASVGCCGPCGGWAPMTYDNYGPCHSCGAMCTSDCGPTCTSDCGSGSCGSSCTSCTSRAPVVTKASCGCEGSCDGSCGQTCNTCGKSPCGCGIHNWPNPFAHLFACSGCGPLYWSEWHNDPPDVCDACDCHGNWTGHSGSTVRYHGPPRRGSAFAGSVPAEAAPEEVVLEEGTVVEKAE